MADYGTVASVASAAGTSHACNAPASSAVGDRLVAIVRPDDPTTVTATGWTQRQNIGSGRICGFDRAHDGSASYSFGTSASLRTNIVIVRVTGSNPVHDVSPGPTSPTPPPR